MLFKKSRKISLNTIVELSCYRGKPEIWLNNGCVYACVTSRALHLVSIMCIVVMHYLSMCKLML